MTEKKLLDIKKIALSFLYIPFLQKQELVCKLLDKISIERNRTHIRYHIAHIRRHSSPLYEKNLR